MIPGNINTDLISGADEVEYQVTKSLRFNSSDSAFLSRTPASAGNRKTWTWSGWVKLNNSSSNFFWGAGPTSGQTNYNYARFGVFNDKIQFLTAGQYIFTSTAVYRDYSAWGHITLVCDTTQAVAADRLKVYYNSVAVTNTAPATLDLNGDYAFNAAEFHAIGSESRFGSWSGYLADVHFIDGQALTPSSFTEVSATTGQLIPKQYTGSFGTNGFWLKFSDNSAATATTLGKDYSGNNNNWTPNNLSVYQATSIHWSSTYPLYSGTPYLAFDGTTSTVVQLQTGGSLTVNFAPGIPVSSSVGLYTESSTYISGARINGGTTVSNPNGSTGNWTIPFSGTMTSIEVFTTGAGTAQNWYRTQVDGANLIIPVGGASVNDSLTDTPSSYGTDTGAGGEVRGNYCTMNPLANPGSSILSNGNLDVVTASASYGKVNGTIAVSSGKWYWEVVCTVRNQDAFIGIEGVANANTNTYTGGSATGTGWYNGGTIYSNASFTSYGTTYAANDVIGVALDMDAGTLVFYKNGVSAGTAKSGLSGSFTASVSDGATSGSGNTYVCNFGQRPFAYTAPSGFKALCDTNLPAPTIVKPSTVMDVDLYTGTSANHTRTLNFSPDLVWIKQRGGGTAHCWYDVQRGSTLALRSNLTNAEADLGSSNSVTFNSDGYTLGADSAGFTNYTGVTYAAWCWDAGSSTVTNTQGSITSQVRANASAGFSIVTYTGTGSAGTVGHGLNAAPSMIILKNRDTTANWLVYHSSRKDGYNPQQNMLYLSSTGVGGTGNTYPWNNTAPTSTVFSIGGGDYGQITNGSKIVAYCFAPVNSYSAFGSYQGNGSADGPFVYTGFRPRYVLIKVTSTAGDWMVKDALRTANYNPQDGNLYAGQAYAEDTVATVNVDFLSNGFKIRGTYGSINASAATFVYAAFAESPFQYARAR